MAPAAEVVSFTVGAETAAFAEGAAALSANRQTASASTAERGARGNRVRSPGNNDPGLGDDDLRDMKDLLERHPPPPCNVPNGLSRRRLLWRDGTQSVTTVATPLAGPREQMLERDKYNMIYGRGVYAPSEPEAEDEDAPEYVEEERQFTDQGLEIVMPGLE